MRSRWIEGLVVGCVIGGGCAFDSSSASATGDLANETEGDQSDTTGSGGDSVDPTTDDPGPTTDPGLTTGPDPTTDPSASTDSTTGPDPTSETTTGSDGTDTTATADPAHLEVSGADFGDVAYQDSATSDFTVENTGAQAATDIMVAVSGGFSVEANDCPATLDAGKSCTVTLRPPTSVLGPASTDLVVDYATGEGADAATLVVSADVIGSTAELVSDGGFEGCNGGWEVVSGTWECVTSVGGVGPHAGANFLTASEGAPNTDITYQLDIDVSAFAGAIATNTMTFDFSAYARARVSDDDDHRIRVTYLAADDSEISSFGTPYQSFTDWTLLANSAPAPSNTAVIRIHLQCQKSSGTYCDAYFDDVSLVGGYGL